MRSEARLDHVAQPKGQAKGGIAVAALKRMSGVMEIVAVAVTVKEGGKDGDIDVVLSGESLRPVGSDETVLDCVCAGRRVSDVLVREETVGEVVVVGSGEIVVVGRKDADVTDDVERNDEGVFAGRPRE